jgi:hypothetical protein
VWDPNILVYCTGEEVELGSGHSPTTEDITTASEDAGLFGTLMYFNNKETEDQTCRTQAYLFTAQERLSSLWTQAVGTVQQRQDPQVLIHNHNIIIIQIRPATQ